ncbi:hypothetical protein LA080_006403 [Diaporthe eres]|nr:hypothetical protein LA080_006403 [Diaporthe eres]
MLLPTSTSSTWATMGYAVTHHSLSFVAGFNWCARDLLQSVTAKIRNFMMTADATLHFAVHHDSNWAADSRKASFPAAVDDALRADASLYRHRRSLPSAHWTECVVAAGPSCSRAWLKLSPASTRSICAPAVAVAASSAEGTASIPNTKALTSMASVMQAERRDPETDTRSPRTPPLGKAALMHILQPLYPTSQGSYAADVLGDVNVSDASFHGISGAPFFVVGQGEQDGSRPRTPMCYHRDPKRKQSGYGLFSTGQIRDLRRKTKLVISQGAAQTWPACLAYQQGQQIWASRPAKAGCAIKA